MTPETRAQILEVLMSTDRLLEEMIGQQRTKVFRLAREAVPDITPDDVLNPHDFPELKAHATFEFEDGILSGYIASQMAIRARIIAPQRFAEDDAPET